MGPCSKLLPAKVPKLSEEKLENSIKVTAQNFNIKEAYEGFQKNHKRNNSMQYNNNPSH
jgi:hypothetical protein